MKKKRIACLTAAFALAMQGIPSVSAAETPALLDVSGFQIMDENLVYIGADYLNPASVLFNQQDKVPASPDNTKVDSETWAATKLNQNWKPNWQAEFGDDTFYIDMGANYVITGICFLDTNGVQDWAIEDGEPFAWKKIGAFTTDAYQTWRGVTIEKPRATRYLRFSTACGDSGVSELAIYGYLASELSEAQIAKTAAKPSGSAKTELSAGQRIGFNAFIDDPMTAIMAGGNVREYHNFSWLLDEKGKVKFTQGTWGDMDSYYSAMKARNISIIPCFQGGSTVVSGGTKPPEIPIPEGADSEDAASYAVHAQAMYQVAARYGSNPDVDPKTLNVAEGSEPKIGMGLLNTLENANEPNKTWSGKANYFSPYELAAMCSADYDGHEGTIPNAGVKQADPDFKLAVGGLLNTASVLDYLSEMKLWFDYHRSDGKFAVDTINVHLGPDAANPEESHLAEQIGKIQDWIRDNAPGTELWISEFEIPMSDCETEGVDNHDNEKYQLRYAQRLARTYLTAIGAGVDRLTKFQLRDEGEGVYYNSGIVTQKGSWSKKLAWYYTSCMTGILKNAYFAADMKNVTNVTDIKNYFFIDKANGDSIYCLWLPSGTDAVKKNYQLSVPEKAHVYLTVPGTYAEGVTTELPVKDKTVVLDVSETPVFVRIASEPKTIVNGKGKRILPKAISLTKDFSGEVCDLTAVPKDSNLKLCYQMFDEPATMPDFIYGDTAGLGTPETNATGAELTCYVKLDQPYALDGFGVYDTYGTGSFEIYDANTDTLLWSSNLGTYMTRDLVLTEASAPTDFLKIVKTGGDLNEAALFGYAVPSDVLHDINCDGKFDAKDITALQNWLLTKSGSLANWNAGDVNSDLCIDSRDLTLLKRAFSK